jgi:hypothetical protein
MRFAVAVVAAFLILMMDFDATSSQAPSHPAINNPRLHISSPTQTFLAAASFFESANASEEPAAAIGHAESASRPAPTEKADPFCHALKDAAEASEIPVSFFARLIWQESRFRSDEISHAGAQGVAQFMPETAAEVGLDDPFDPFKALPASAQLLRRLRDQFGNLGLAAAAYNAGSGRIQKWLAKESELPRETRDYVRIITGTEAKNWTDEAQTLNMRLDLPSEAPCEGVGGLSKTKDFEQVPVSLAPAVTTIIRKAEAAVAAAKLSMSRARKRVALSLKVRKVAAVNTTRSAKTRPLLASRTAGRRARIRIASATR